MLKENLKKVDTQIVDNEQRLTVQEQDALFNKLV